MYIKCLCKEDTIITDDKYFNKNFDYCLLKQNRYGVQSICFNRNGIDDAVMTVEKCKVPFKMKYAILLCKNTKLMNEAVKWIKNRNN